MVRAVDNRVASTKESLSMSQPVLPDDEGAEPEPQGCLAAVLKLFGIRLQSADGPPVADVLPYRLSQRFLSPAELSFYKVLVKVIPEDTVVAVKPRLGDILFVPRGSSGRWAFQNKIQSKHVDFLVCDAKTMTPSLAIELDDKSHERADRTERDEFVDQAFAAAGIQVLHFKARSGYVPEDIRAQVHSACETQLRVPVVPSSKNQVPNCPNCRIPMIQRTASKGPQKGHSFWGCENYPNCRMTIPFG